MYAEEALENTSNTSNNDGLITPTNGGEQETSSGVKFDEKSASSLIGQEENVAKILQIAKIKVNETELAKQSSDIEQIVALRIYDEKRVEVEQMEKSMRKVIEKSREYFELKAATYKELRFLFTKIEGLKSCLKEAKLAYHQSLKNLETISTEIHTQRQTNGKASVPPTTLISNSSSTLSSSSSSISFQDQQQR